MNEKRSETVVMTGSVSLTEKDGTVTLDFVGLVDELAAWMSDPNRAARFLHGRWQLTLDTEAQEEPG